MNRTRIEWTEVTWNPIRGCSHVSEGCRNCYAAQMAHRFSGPGQPYEGLTRQTPHGPRWTGEVRLVPEVLDLPLRWHRPRMIFVNSMSDLFHESVPDEWIDRVFAVMALAHWHKFQVLTKRPQRMLEWFNRPHEKVHEELLFWWRHPERWPLPNVWIGVSVENQQAADERIPLLLQVPAVVRFLSCEPLLGPVDLSRYLGLAGAPIANLDEGTPGYCDWCGGWVDGQGHDCYNPQPGIHWVIVGGESGPKARPMHPDWIRSLRDQCQAAGVPFFFKQHGEWLHSSQKGSGDPLPALPVSETVHHWPDGSYSARVGKRAAGALLDGREWREWPDVARGVTG